MNLLNTLDLMNRELDGLVQEKEEFDKKFIEMTEVNLLLSNKLKENVQNELLTLILPTLKELYGNSRYNLCSLGAIITLLEHLLDTETVCFVKQESQYGDVISVQQTKWLNTLEKVFEGVIEEIPEFKILSENYKDINPIERDRLVRAIRYQKDKIDVYTGSDEFTLEPMF